MLRKIINRKTWTKTKEMKTIQDIKLEWQKHNRDNGLSWNEVAELVNEVERAMQPDGDEVVYMKVKTKDRTSDCYYQDYLGWLKPLPLKSLYG